MKTKIITRLLFAALGLFLMYSVVDTFLDNGGDFSDLKLDVIGSKDVSVSFDETTNIITIESTKKIDQNQPVTDWGKAYIHRDSLGITMPYDSGTLISDARNKENIDTTFVPDLLNIKVRHFNMLHNTQLRTGFIAQELLKDSVTKQFVLTDSKGYHQVLYIDLLVHEVMAQRRKIDSLISIN